MNFKSFLHEVYSNDIARRSFAKNGFDGVLTVLGILMALFLAGVSDSSLVVFSCFGSGIAVSVSGLWGAYVTESAEREHTIKQLEKHLMRKLSRSGVRRASLIVALVDGLTPLIFTILLMIPFFLPISIGVSFTSSFVLSGVLISLLGVFLARISKANPVNYVLKMLSATVVISLILYLIELLS